MAQKPIDIQYPENEFTAICTRYYKLKQLLAKRRDRLQSLLDNAPAYTGQSQLTELDALISYYRKTQAYKAKTDNTQKDLEATGQSILAIMQYFEMPLYKTLTGVIPGELEYEIFACEDSGIYITKTQNLAPEVLNPNIMVIKLWRPEDGDLEDDE